MKDNDGSHDWFHVDRVRRTALTLAKEEGTKDLQTVELAALLHDIKDWKYSGEHSAGEDAVRAFLEAEQVPAEVVDKVAHVVKFIGYKTELGLIGQGKEVPLTPELAVVQDADRLDAIGAIGTARTFTYGGMRKRAMYDPARAPIKNITQEAYIKQHSENNHTVNHFYEKLLKLTDMMKTDAGRKRAKQRHEFMELFLKQFYAEWNCE
eukprot:TRINITY_DN17130_c0_g1_i1.p2 TRINITY_DN17130_c0_g1~~TRINITY_DN17130_c0_g1_i1.p2  ORF type:complete len:208 (-),score=130.42 TRINITY_DN17130_c0_g1_i1:71-694(-)